MEPEATRSGISVAHVALELFTQQGFEETSVEQIAQAAGISRSKFFRQFGSKEEVLFVDHAELLKQASTLLELRQSEPWQAVCDAAELVFAHFASTESLARKRYEVVNSHHGLRDKELITVFSYEHLFANYLRKLFPLEDPLLHTRFAASVIATHNFMLREFMRGNTSISVAKVRQSLQEVRQIFGVEQGSSNTASTVVAVLNFPSNTPKHQIAQAVQTALDAST